MYIYIYYKLSYSINIGLNFGVALLYVLYIKCLVQKRETRMCNVYLSITILITKFTWTKLKTSDGYCVTKLQLAG